MIRVLETTRLIRCLTEKTAGISAGRFNIICHLLPTPATTMKTAAVESGIPMEAAAIVGVHFTATR